MARLKNALFAGILAVIVVVLSVGLVAFIRYSQISFMKTTAASDKYLFLQEYRSRLVIDSGKLSVQTRDIIKSLSAGQSPADPELNRRLAALKADGELTLKGLNGGITPAVNYAKAMQPPAGASQEVHERYRQAVTELLRLVNELAKKEELTDAERARFEQRLEIAASNMEGSLKNI